MFRGIGRAPVLGMSLGRIDSTIYGPHLVNPDRCVVPAPCKRPIVPGPKPFDAPPGVVPFHRALEAENLASRREANQTPAASTPCRPRDQVIFSEPAKLLPTLGEVLPVTDIHESVTIETTRQVQLPATGRVLDLYI